MFWVWGWVMLFNGTFRIIQIKFANMKIISFFLLLVISSCNSNTDAQVKQPCHTPPSQLKVKHEFNSIILDGFCDSTEMAAILDSLMIDRNIPKCHAFRTDSAFELFYRKGKNTKEEDEYLWANYLGHFYCNKVRNY
jgi:hypothetical protein